MRGVNRIVQPSLRVLHYPNTSRPILIKCPEIAFLVCLATIAICSSWASKRGDATFTLGFHHIGVNALSLWPFMAQVVRLASFGEKRGQSPE